MISDYFGVDIRPPWPLSQLELVVYAYDKLRIEPKPYGQVVEAGG